MAAYTREGAHLQNDVNQGFWQRGHVPALCGETGDGASELASQCVWSAEVRTFEMTEQDEFMVIGCDGIWERIDNQGVFARARATVACAVNEWQTE